MVHLRSGRVDDSASIVSFWRESEAEPTTTDDPERIEHLIATDPDAVIVAEDLGRIIGKVIAGWMGGEVPSTDWPSRRTVAVRDWVVC
jgi:hypothetical protein